MERFREFVPKGDGHDQTYWKCPNCGMVTTDYDAEGTRIVCYDDSEIYNKEKETV